MKNDDVISSLNDLIETSKDGELGFRICSEDAVDEDLKTVLASKAHKCAQAVRELQELVRFYGGVPETGGSLAGSLHRRWVNIKMAIAGKDDEEILNECERGEDVAIHNYRRALQNCLPQEAYYIVQHQFNGVLQNHDLVKTLRNQVRSRAHS